MRRCPCHIIAGIFLATTRIYAFDAKTRTFCILSWQLGEHNEWCKTTLFELAVHIPFMIRDPRAPHGNTGERTMAFAENVDIYRTLADLAGLSSEVDASVDGHSLAPLLRASPPASNIDYFILSTGTI